MTGPSQGRRIRVLIAKVGLDGHDRGAKIVARALRDAGFEVLYTGIRQTPEMVAVTALQEAVDAVGVSLLSGSHRELCPRVSREIRKAGIRPLLFGGGVIPAQDRPFLRKHGYAEIFGPGTPTGKIVEFLQKKFRRRK